MRALLSSLVLVALVAAPALTTADTVTLSPIKDNTLYNNTVFPLSNGLGEYLFVGQTVSASFSLRRGLLAFDVASSIPAGAVITGATLTLNMNKTIAGATDITAHRLTSDWGEGTSDAFGQEGGGTNATTGDATWIHTFFDTDTWTNQGGDFVGAPSATTSVGGPGPYTWSGAGMVADVQYWLDNAGQDFGWLLRGDENTAPTAKRFISKDSLSPQLRPSLVVDFEPVIPVESKSWGAVKSLMSETP